MTAKPKQFRKLIRQLEDAAGPIHLPTATLDPAVPEVFVAVFGRPPGRQQVEVLGGAALAAGATPSPNFVIADPDTASALRAGAVPTQVGFAWVEADGAATTTMRAAGGPVAAARATTTQAARVQTPPVRRTPSSQASGTTHTDSRTVSDFGHRPGDTPEALEAWAIELSTPTVAPLPPSSLPPGSIPASGWCAIFPFLAMCKSH